MAQNLFVYTIEAIDPIYNNVRDGSEEYFVESRAFMRELWESYKPYADSNFQQQLQVDFDARFWEMYLTCALIQQKLPIQHHRDIGPDALLDDSSLRVWIEATTPEGGSEHSHDRVPRLITGQANEVPDKQITLRYRSAIKDKFDIQYSKWVCDGTISPKDAFIVALNSCKIESAMLEMGPPRIVKAVFPIGFPQVRINKVSMQIVDTSYQYRPVLTKSSGAAVSTELFTSKSYEQLSGILYSRASIRNWTRNLGEDFIFIHNPTATNKIPLGYFEVKREYFAVDNGDGSYSLTYHSINKNENTSEN